MVIGGEKEEEEEKKEGGKDGDDDDDDDEMEEKSRVEIRGKSVAERGRMVFASAARMGRAVERRESRFERRVGEGDVRCVGVRDVIAWMRVVDLEGAGVGGVVGRGGGEVGVSVSGVGAGGSRTSRGGCVSRFVWRRAATSSMEGG